MEKENFPFWEAEEKCTIKEAEERKIPQSQIAFARWNWEYIFSIPEKDIFTLEPSPSNQELIEALEGKTSVTAGYARTRALTHKVVYQMFLEYIRDTVVRV